MTRPLNLDGDEFDTDDTIDVPIGWGSARTLLEVLGIETAPASGGCVMAFKPPTGPTPTLPLRYGDCDLGRWRVDGFRAEVSRSRYDRLVMTLRKVADCSD